jgi:hypothetical protein
MNRTLKFRIWSKRVNQYIDIDTGNYDFSVNELFHELQKNSVIQQYTGLKDKNGKEIYEGDRVRSSYTGNVDFFGEVIWLEDRASFGVRTGNAFETFEDLMDYMKYFEVVGNIFQLPCNPDHNGECLVCDCWLSDCQFQNKENNDQDI